MDVETLAEVLCNLTYGDPNDPQNWADALEDAQDQFDAVKRGEMEPWWEDESR